MEKSPFISIQNGEISIHFFWEAFSPFFLQNMKMQMKNASQKKMIFLHSEWRFLHSFFFRSVLNFLLKKKRYRNFSPFKIEKSPYWMEISPCFSEVFLIFFWKTNIYREFSPFRMEKYPFWMKISPFIFSEAFWFFIEKQTPQISPFKIGQFSPFWIEISPFMFFFQKWFELKKNLQIMFSIQFFSEVFWTFFLKNKFHK